MTDSLQQYLERSPALEKPQHLNHATFALRLRRFLSNAEFRKHPYTAVRKRLYWRLHWKLLAQSPFLYRLPTGRPIRLAHSTASYGIYLNGGFSDPSLAQLFSEHLKPGMIVFDCGAHIGEYTLQFAHLVGEAGQVHAFEPDPRVYAYLESNIAINQLPNVVLNHLGLSDREARATFCLQRDATTSSLQDHAVNLETQKITVQTTTLDAYALSNHLNRIDVLKIDVEGAEAAVLTGACRVLQRSQPGLIFVECDRPANVGPVKDSLHGAGYHVECRSDALHLHPHIVARKGSFECT